MIFHDTVTVLTRVAGADYDAHGNVIYHDVETPERAEVRPLSTSEPFDPGRDVVITRYKVFLPPWAMVTSSTALRWRGSTYEVDGDVEPHTSHGRTHHLEAVIRRVSG